MTKQKSQVEVKIYTTNSTELYELLPQEYDALSLLSRTKQSYSDYKGIMPIEVEKIYKLAKPLMWDIQVWEVVVTPDPFLIGILPSKVYLSSVPKGMKRILDDYENVSLERAKELTEEYKDKVKITDWQASTAHGVTRYCLLAQWGRELKELSKLVKIAKEKYIVEKRRRLVEQKLEAEKNLRLLELEAEEKFGVIY